MCKVHLCVGMVHALTILCRHDPCFANLVTNRDHKKDGDIDDILKYKIIKANLMDVLIVENEITSW